MEPPAWLPFEAFAEAREAQDVPAIFTGLWCTGSLRGLACAVIAIVGTRAATGYGKRLAHRFAADLGAAGCCIISGLALGIDSAAHEGALDAGAPTIGVLGSGHAAFFPRRNRELANRVVAAGGAVLSPYSPEHRAFPSQFLERNGVVAALSDAVVVIEAPARSGALNTAGWAAGRIPVFAVPGDVDRKHVDGCHALIRDGAILARSAQDVLCDLRLAGAKSTASHAVRKTSLDGNPVAQSILTSLSEGEASLEELIARSKAPPAAALTALSFLEIEGLIEARPGLRYALR